MTLEAARAACKVLGGRLLKSYSFLGLEGRVEGCWVPPPAGRTTPALPGG